jgi:hypothetical protein
MALLNRTLYHVRTASTIAPTRPAYALGLRAAVATVAPLLAAGLLDRPSAGTWMSIAAMNGVLADPGGSDRTRAATLSYITAVSAAAAAIGTLAAPHQLAAVALAFALAAGAGLVRALGSVGVSFGVSVVLTYVVALAVPPAGGAEPLVRAGLVLLGGAWAMLLVLVLWPVRPYRAARSAVAACYRALEARDAPGRGARRTRGSCASARRRCGARWRRRARCWPPPGARDRARAGRASGCSRSTTPPTMR